MNGIGVHITTILYKNISSSMAKSLQLIRLYRIQKTVAFIHFFFFIFFFTWEASLMLILFLIEKALFILYSIIARQPLRFSTSIIVCRMIKRINIIQCISMELVCFEGYVFFRSFILFFFYYLFLILRTFVSFLLWEAKSIDQNETAKRTFNKMITNVL